MIAYTQRLGFDVLAAPVAELDRRALSQAWYSALHFPRPEAASAHLPNPRIVSAPVGAKPRCGEATREQHGLATTPRLRSAPALVPRNVHVVERRAPRSRFVGKIERAFLSPRRQARSTSFVIGDGGGRLHLIVRSSGDRVHLIAICAPPMRERVAAALAQARFGLARRGIGFDGRLAERGR